MQPFGGNVGIGTSSPSQKLEVSGTAYATSDFRAPIFYDSNNTAYYVDPASTSNLVGLTVANTITGSITGNAGSASSVAWGNVTSKPTLLQVNGNNQTLDGITNDGTTYWAAGATNAPPTTYGSLLTVTGGIGWYNQLGFGTNDTMYFRQSINNTTSWTAWKTILNSSNYTAYSSFSGAVYGTIYYDANNTGYYVDPASTSNLNQANFAGNVNFFSQLAVENQSTFCRLAFNKLTFWDWQGSGDIVTIDGGYLQAANSLRAPIFYSSDNTAKYFSANTTSYGAWYMGGSNNGYSGFRVDGDMHLMMGTGGAAGPCGFWLNNWSILTYVNAAQYLYHNGSEKFRTDGGGIYVTGTVYATGDVIAYYSDIRLKKDVTLIDNALGKIKQLRGVTYIWNDEEVNTIKDRAGTKDIGLIAQEVEAVEPLLITEYQSQLNTPSNDPDEANDFVPRMSPTYKTIKYEKIVALLVEGIKEQQKEIEELKELVNKLINK
jgi:hypothetical protein